MPADLVLFNGRVATLGERRPEAAAVAVQDGRILATGPDAQVMRHAGAGTRLIDLHNRRAMPGLIDSHTHLIRGGLTGVMGCACGAL